MTSVPITRYSISGFQQKSTGHAKRQEKTQCEEPKQISEPDSDMTEFEIIRQVIKTIIIKYVKGVNGKSKKKNMQEQIGTKSREELRKKLGKC